MQAKKIKTHLRAAAYIRVSSEEQAKAGDSLRDQKERCLEYIEKREDATLQGIYIDDGVSGQKLDRNEFEHLMEEVGASRVDLIIFTKLDRWFRSLRHYLNTQVTLEDHDVAWIAIDQPYFDTSTPHGRAFVNQSMMWAELEAQNDSVRIRDVFENKVKYGEVITGKVPRGYEIEDKHLVLNGEAPMVADLFHYYLTSGSLRGTLNYLKNEYGTVMTLNNLKKSILQNPKYIGFYRGNDHYCPPIVSAEVFQEVQRILSAKINVKSSQKYPYLFTGLLRCQDCGGRLSGCQINVLSKKKYRYRYPAYACSQYSSRRNCGNGGEIRETRIENYLLEGLKQAVAPYWARYEIRGSAAADNRPKKNAIRMKLERLKDLYLNGMLSLDDYKAERAEWIGQLNEIPDLVEPKQDFTALRDLLDKDFQRLYETFDNQEKRQFWRSVLKEVHISKSVNRQRQYTVFFL